MLHFVNKELPLIVMITSTKWNEAPRMRHHICWQLLRWYNVLFVEFLPNENVETEEISVKNDRLLVYRPFIKSKYNMRIYANHPYIHARINMSYADRINKMIDSLSTKKTILFNFVYHFPEIIKTRTYDYKVYVCTDEFPGMQRRAQKRNALISRYQQIIFQNYENEVANLSDLCLTPHYPLKNKLSKVNDNVQMLYHAHTSKTICSNDISQKPKGKINVGFYGYINYRINISWIEEIIKDENITVFLVGPNDGKEYYEFSKKTNVKVIPPVEGEGIEESMKMMDVLIMPYDTSINEVSILTTNSKIFQYIASCRPIVISDLKHYIKMPYGVFYKAKTKEEFKNMVHLAYNEDCKEYRETRSRIARTNTWDNRGEQIKKILNDATGY